ncbi:MAG: hypothetical protein QXX99_07035 [Candidatus Bathyarchaeia archaeon]
MYFILSEVLGYKDVKVYDGSAQEWTGNPSLPVVYEGLGTDYLGLQKLYKGLSDTFSSLQKSRTTLESDYFSLKGKYNELEKGYGELKGEYDKLKRGYDELKEDYEKLRSEYGELVKTTTTSYLTIIFIVTTIIFLALSAYLAIRLRAVKK